MGGRIRGRMGQKVAGLVLAAVTSVGAWSAAAMPAQAATSYATYGQRGANVVVVQSYLAKLKYMSVYSVTGYYGSTTRSAVITFQRAVGLRATGTVDMTTYSALRARVHPSATVNRIDKRCLTGARVICADKTLRKVYLVRYGKVTMTMDARFGRPSMPTGEGTFRIYWKDIDHVSRAYDAAMPYSMFFNGGQAVHYSSDFARYGYTRASHGCINIRSYSSVAKLYSIMRVGDRVVVYWS